MKKVAQLLLLPLVSLVVSAHVQQIEYGQLSELKGIRRVFIDTGTDIKNRERIIKELEKSKVGLAILSSPEGAELILTFGAETVTTGATARTLPPLSPGLPSRTQVRSTTNEVGQGIAYVPIGPNRRRIIFAWKGEQLLFAKTATKFASNFMKAYKKANDTK